jgi:hypothetical protein
VRPLQPVLCPYCNQPVSGHWLDDCKASATGGQADSAPDQTVQDDDERRNGGRPVTAGPPRSV